MKRDWNCGLAIRRAKTEGPQNPLDLELPPCARKAHVGHTWTFFPSKMICLFLESYNLTFCSYSWEKRHILHGSTRKTTSKHTFVPKTCFRFPASRASWPSQQACRLHMVLFCHVCLGKAIPHSGDLGAEARVFFMSRRWHQSRIRSFIFSEPVSFLMLQMTVCRLACHIYHLKPHMQQTAVDILWMNMSPWESTLVRWTDKRWMMKNDERYVTASLKAMIGNGHLACKSD